MKIVSYLYDADGQDRRIDLDADTLPELNDSQLLWINVLERDKESVERVARALKLEKIPLRGILRTAERPKIYKFGDFYHFYIVSVETDEVGNVCPIPIDFLVGKNFVVTVHEGDVAYLQAFAGREQGETSIGGLDPESFVGTMLDLHIVTYFQALERIETTVDKMDGLILQRDLRDEDLLRGIVRLRGEVSKMRRWFLPHRDIFYTLARPDFKIVAESDSFENFQVLNQHFESAVEAIESSRDTVLSLFDLYAGKAAHRMNSTVKRLTFITLVVGSLGAIAGVWGMNFEVEYFKSAEKGFWLTLSAMGLLVVALTIVAKWRRWI